MDQCQNNVYYNNNYGVFDNNNNNKQYNYVNEDVEWGSQKMNLELNMRLGFIRKVYGILSVQLLITTFLCIISMTNHSFAKFQMNNTWVIWLCAIGAIISMLVLSCFRDLARKVPTNYILLLTFTAFESYLVSAMCAITSPRLVLMAAAMTCGVTIALTMYACTTKSDFTICGSLLFVLGMILLLFSIFAIFTHNKIFHVIISCFGVLLFSFYLIYDTQLLLGTKENSIEMDDYIYAALMLYLDIINLFIYILKLLKETE
jgi:protein lifeguard